MSRGLAKEHENVIPAQAGIQNEAEVWIPTYVGMTGAVEGFSNEPQCFPVSFIQQYR